MDPCDSNQIHEERAYECTLWSKLWNVYLLKLGGFYLMLERQSNDLCDDLVQDMP